MLCQETPFRRTCVSAKATLWRSHAELTVRMNHGGGRVRTGRGGEAGPSRGRGRREPTRVGKKTSEEGEADEGRRLERQTPTDREEELKGPRGMTAAPSARSTFSLGPEDEGPQGGDHLKLVVAKSSHLLDAAGQDHPLGVHLLKGGGEERVKGRKPRRRRITLLLTSVSRTGSAAIAAVRLVVECVTRSCRRPRVVFQFENATERRPPSNCSRSSLIVSHCQKLLPAPPSFPLEATTLINGQETFGQDALK